MPKFCQHLRRIQMTADYFTSKWFMTLFACFLPYEMLPPIFDMFLVEGWKAIFRIGIAVLKQLEPTLLKMEMTEMCVYFRETVRKKMCMEKFALFSCAQRVRVNKILVTILAN
jgi:hypothetical protein